jgi:2-methylcitrate dehydratase
MTTEPALADRLARYAHALTYDDLDAETVERVKVHLIDSIGCAFAAFDERPVRACREVALAVGAGPSRVLGASGATTADLAAFANAAAIRYYDLNDVYVGRPSTHPSDTVGACLAVAEAERASPAELITAIVLAYEINCRLVDDFDLSARGWDAPVFTLPAVALAAGKLMKLSREQLTHAVNIAINDHIPLGQTRAGALSDWKGLGDPEAARNAVFAALLARKGLTGPAPIFEGKKGLFALVTGEAAVDVASFGRRGIEFRILRCGMKAYPVVVYGQTTIPAAAALAREVGDLGAITAIEIATSKRGYQQAGNDPAKWAPGNKDTADHSLPYIAARAMFDGDIGHGSFAPEKLRDLQLHAFMQKITVIEDPSFTKPGGHAPPTRITATLRDGRRIVRQVDNSPGFPGQPMTRADVEHKFRGNLGARWPRERTDAFLRALWTLEDAPSVAEVFAQASS